ncbi:hypothetical protein [Pedobacter panaciterrae]
MTFVEIAAEILRSKPVPVLPVCSFAFETEGVTNSTQYPYQNSTVVDNIYVEVGNHQVNPVWQTFRKPGFNGRQLERIPPDLLTFWYHAHGVDQNIINV